MHTSIDRQTLASELLAAKDLRIISCEPIQTLWAGYGHICHIKALSSTQSSGNDSKPQSLILKHVSPPPTTKRRMSGALDEGHIRKILSYQVEHYFYTHLAPRMPREITVASCLTSIQQSVGPSNTIALMLTDLRDTFPVAGEKRAELNETQVDAALRWLASFHGFWWSNADEVRRLARVRPPLEHFKQHQSTDLGHQAGIWLNGGYTYLATRQKEYMDLEADISSEWSAALCIPVRPGTSSIANLAASLLSSSATQAWQTLIHGDVKSENLFTTAEGDAVAFYDFQYVGLGLSVCDLAKLFTCSVPLRMLVDDGVLPAAPKLEMQRGEENLLRAYHDQLQRRSEKAYPWNLFIRHWETALVDWLRFQASWGFWGNSEWLETRVRSILADREWLVWLENNVVG